MDCRRPGKIMEAQLAQPTAAPDPVAGYRVDKCGNAEGIDAVGNIFRPFGHRAGDDGSRRGAEHSLKDQIGKQRHSIGQDGAVVPPDEGVQAPD